jgi:Flp pilus assembly pilin Flp
MALAWLGAGDGGTAVEYALLAGLAAILALGAIVVVGNNLEALYMEIATRAAAVMG